MHPAHPVADGRRAQLCCARCAVLCTLCSLPCKRKPPDSRPWNAPVSARMSEGRHVISTKPQGGQARVRLCLELYAQYSNQPASGVTAVQTSLDVGTPAWACSALRQCPVLHAGAMAAYGRTVMRVMDCWNPQKDRSRVLRAVPRVPRLPRGVPGNQWVPRSPIACRASP